MPIRWISGLRNHAHVLLIVPLVVIVMTWPTFARILDSQDFWLHTAQNDFWFRIWDAWHLERVLTGRASLFYTDAMFHPQGVSLAFQHFSFPHALLFMAFNKVMTADSVYNLLFLLILCFNAFCAYILIRYLISDKWIALFGAVVAGVSVPFPYGSTVPDLIMFGTIPLTIYFFHRHVKESRWLFAALAGLCAGATAFISIYIFFINLMTIGITAVFLARSHWKEPAFARGLLLILVLCIGTSSFRFYPMIVDASVLKEGLETRLEHVRSNDVLDCCVVTQNPVTGNLFHKLFTFPPDSATMGTHLGYNTAYLGYINLFLLVCAIFHRPLRPRLAPWLAVLVFFAVLRLGHFLTINGIEYRHVLLPEHFLTEWFPAIFGSFYVQEYYQFGVVTPLAILACYGLARLVRSKPASVRYLVLLLSGLMLLVEFFFPFSGNTIERSKMAYIDWLSAETDSAIKLIDLPQVDFDLSELYYLGLQAFHGYPTASGSQTRTWASAHAYIWSNALLRTWEDSRSPHCLPYNERVYLSALDQLLADGFTHVVVHNWLYGDQFVMHGFRGIPAAYDDGFVSVYRLRDLRLSCDSKRIEFPQFSHFAASPAAIPGLRSSILSFHPSESVDEDLFAYLASLFSDWHSLLQLHLVDGELVTQSAGMSYPDLDAFARDNQVIVLLYDSHETEATALQSLISIEEFHLCQREEHEDGSVIEIYLHIEFSCRLVASSQPLQVDYDNGAMLVNAVVDVAQDILDIQLIWSNLPDEPHSVSLQVFDAEGAKVLGQDSTIGLVSLARHRLDISSLPPGEFQIKLIIYNYETGRSVAGTASETGEIFERELTITTLDRR